MTSPDDTNDLPFRRPMRTDRLRVDAETRFRITAEPGERAALARFLGVDAVERLTLAGFVSPKGKGGWRVRGRLVAQIVQTCVVTLEPVRSRIDEEIERSYIPESFIRRQPEIVLLPDEEDAPDPFIDSIDPAQLAVESLALLIDPYPRREGATLEPGALGADSAALAEDKTTRPFAGLADLLRRSGTGGG
jgi:uncharacterized metal-binding protein YceD (DUF177 family)